MRLAAALLLLWASSAGAFAGEFPVCEARAQYVRVEIMGGFAPANCIAAAWAQGDIRPALLLLAGVIVPVCAEVSPGMVGADNCMIRTGRDRVSYAEFGAAFRRCLGE